MHDQNCPKIVAEQDGGVFLLDLGNDRGQICDTEAGKIFPAQNINSILARGYWQPCADVDAADVLALVKPPYDRSGARDRLATVASVSTGSCHDGAASGGW
jgi:hypothetical protein